MGAQIRVYRRKIASTSSMKKIFKAMEMIATSRINRARRRSNETGPYANALTRAVSAVATQTSITHPLISDGSESRRSAVLVMTSDMGKAGSYSVNAIKKAEGLIERLRQDGREVELYIVGRKAQQYYDFRNRTYEKVWTGDTDNPHVETAREIGEVLLDRYSTPYDEGGVDDLHIVYTQFQSMVSQEPKILRLLPLTVVDAKEMGEEIVPGEDVSDDEFDNAASFEFEPSAEEVLDQLLPRYIETRIFSCLLQAAASELASRQRAMKSAGDNADDLVKQYTRLMNNARQAEVTQELSEIVAGADSLAAS